MKNVLEYEPILKNLVLKYNDGIWDNDLMQDAWVKAVECYKHCEKNGITSDDKIQAHIITWVKNDLINRKKKKQLTTVGLDDYLDILQYVDTTLLLVELRNSCSIKENEVLTYLLQGCSVDDICLKMNKSKPQVYRYMKNIKRKLKS